MAYFSPFIDSSGLHMPVYTDIRDQIINDAKNIFGQDIYLGNDSQDYQFISIIAEKIYDSFQLAQYVYNNRSPMTSVGIPLDTIVKLNGIVRKPAIASTCSVVITGTPNNTILNGIAQDVSGSQWALPSSVLIPLSGSIEVTAICTVAGPFVANIGDINQIATPTFGWDAVVNNVASTTGAYEETDAELRARQTVSTTKPSLSLLEGTKSAIAAISGVNRYAVYENYTNITDANGIPGHSISAVVEYGTDLDIATAIFSNKGPGCGTYGDVVYTVTDTYGQTTDINYFRPVYKDIEVVVSVKALAGYTSAITDIMKDNLVGYLNTLQIGEPLTVSSLWGIALQAMSDLKNPLFSILGITAAITGDVQSTNDIPMLFNWVTRSEVAKITVNVT